MDYKKLFAKTMTLLTNPAKAWEEVKSEEQDSISVQSTFVYPMITLCGVAMFVGLLFGNGVEDFNLQLVLTKCCGLLVSLFGGYFLSSYLIGRYGSRISATPSDNDTLKSRQLAGYSMGVIFVLHIFSGLFPAFFILQWILQFYVVYVVWEGAKVLMNISENKLLSYTLFVSAIILTVPILLGKIFATLSSMVNG